MALWISGSPDTIKASESLDNDREKPVAIEVDDFNYLFLTLEQAYSLWHELGAVLQSLDNDTAELSGRRNGKERRALDSSSYVHNPERRAPTAWVLADRRQASTDDDKADSIRNLEDLRGLPHSSDLEQHPSNSRR